jgi:hypothetical protein
MCFVGRAKHHPLRQQLIRELQTFRNASIFISNTLRDWETIYRQSRFVLVPRGVGRGSFRLIEVLQMGLIPVYVYDDFPWLPYYDAINWSSLAILVRRDGMDRLKSLLDMSESEVSAMRRQVLGMRRTHFMPEGALQQLVNLLKSGYQGSDLRCRPDRVQFGKKY